MIMEEPGTRTHLGHASSLILPQWAAPSASSEANKTTNWTKPPPFVFLCQEKKTGIGLHRHRSRSFSNAAWSLNSCPKTFCNERLHIQWIPSVLRKTLNSCWPKTYGKKDMENRKIMGWSALLPKIKKRTKTLRDPTIITFTHFLRTLGVFRRQMCPVTSGRVDNCVRVGERPYACLTISGSDVRCAANARHYRRLYILFLDEKGLIRLFPAIFVWFYLEK